MIFKIGDLLVSKDLLISNYDFILGTPRRIIVDLL